VAVVKDTFIHKQYTEHNATEYPERNIHNNKSKVKVSRDRPRWPKGFQVGKGPGFS